MHVLLILICSVHYQNLTLLIGVHREAYQNFQNMSHLPPSLSHIFQKVVLFFWLVRLSCDWGRDIWSQTPPILTGIVIIPVKVRNRGQPLAALLCLTPGQERTFKRAKQTKCFHERKWAHSDGKSVRAEAGGAKFRLAEWVLTHDNSGGYTWRTLLTRRALSGRSSHQWQSFWESSSIALKVAMWCGGGSGERLDLAQTDRRWTYCEIQPGWRLEGSLYFCLQRVQPVTQVCDPTTVEAIWKKKEKKRVIGYLRIHTHLHVFDAKGRKRNMVTVRIGWGLSSACRGAVQNWWFPQDLLSYKLVSCICNTTETIAVILPSCTLFRVHVPTKQI